MPIMTFNPLRERGLERFTNPQSPVQMIAGGTRISSQYHQVRTGGDAAAIVGICKAVIEADDRAHRRRRSACARCRLHRAAYGRLRGVRRVLPRRRTGTSIETGIGLDRGGHCSTPPDVYMAANAVIANYGMGITQHKHGVETVKMIVNLLLLRGNIGKPGAGISPIRGHSNVQGQRTVGISEKTKLVPLDKLAELYGFEPPRWDGLTTVDACEGILNGDVRGFVSLGGNFVRAIPERSLMEPAWSGCGCRCRSRPSSTAATSSPAKSPICCRASAASRSTSRQAARRRCRWKTSTTCIHGSRGQREPVAEQCPLRAGDRRRARQGDADAQSEGRLGCLGRRLCAGARRHRADLSRPVQGLQRRMFEPGGFPRPLPARERKWKTPNGKANFTVPKAAFDAAARGRRHL